MRVLLITIITIGLLIGVDQGFPKLQRLLGHSVAVPPTFPSDSGITERYSKLVDRKRLSAIADRYAELRDLPPQSLNRIQFQTNFGLMLADCPSIQRSQMGLSPSGKMLYDVTYSYDSQCRRQSVPKNPKAKYFVLALGDSFTFGQGVEDEETYPSQLAERWPLVDVYNYGICGGGPNSLLRNLTVEPTRLQGITQDRGIAVYFFIDSHIQRILCTADCLKSSSYILRQPHYELNSQGDLEYQGKFTDRLWTNLIYWPIAMSGVRQFYGLDFPKVYRKDFQLFVRIMNGLRQQIEEQHPLLDFYVALAPQVRPSYVKNLSPLLKEAGFKVLDYSQINMNPLLGQTYGIPVDGHPSARYYSVLADWIKSDTQASFLNQAPDRHGNGKFGPVGSAF